MAVVPAGIAAEPAGIPKPKVTTVTVDPETGRLVRLRAGAKATPRVSLSRARKEAEKTPEVDPEAIRTMIDETAQRHGVDPHLVHSVIRVESNYMQKAISPKGALGLMQLIPATAKRFGVENPFDPSQNLEGGVRYLKALTQRFEGDLQLALAAYNAGEAAVERYGGIPPYRETQQYVTKVASEMRARGLEMPAAESSSATFAASLPSNPAAANQVDARPVYAPIRAYTDSDGRLHVETVP